MSDLSTASIITERLILVALSEKYAEEIFKEFTPEITKYMFPASPQKIEETLSYIRSVVPKMSDGEELPIIILNKQTGEFLGGGGAHALKTGKPELGIWIKKSAHGNHFGQEAVAALVNWIKNTIAFDYIVYPVDKRNIASCKIAQSLGGKIAAEYKKKNLAGNILDEVEYRIYK